MSGGFLLIVGVLFFLFFGRCSGTHGRVHLAIIPHFMIDDRWVDQFYAFLQTQWYVQKDPDRVIVVSPNHFFSHVQSPQTIQTSGAFFQHVKYQFTPFPGVDDGGYLVSHPDTYPLLIEHGIGAHLPWVQKYFSGVQILPLVVSSHRLSPVNVEDFAFTGDTLVIASVDFSHYLSEPIAWSHDQESISCLVSGTGSWSDFLSLDVDCPACLFLLQQLAWHSSQSAQLWYRDSSSTIVGKDLEEDNTSRVFIWYE